MYEPSRVQIAWGGPSGLKLRGGSWAHRDPDPRSVSCFQEDKPRGTAVVGYLHVAHVTTHLPTNCTETCLEAPSPGIIQWCKSNRTFFLRTVHCTANKNHCSHWVCPFWKQKRCVALCCVMNLGAKGPFYAFQTLEGGLWRLQKSKTSTYLALILLLSHVCLNEGVP